MRFAAMFTVSKTEGDDIDAEIVRDELDEALSSEVAHLFVAHTDDDGETEYSVDDIAVTVVEP